MSGASRPASRAADDGDWIRRGELPNEDGFDYRRLRSRLAHQAALLALRLLGLSSQVAAGQEGLAQATSDPAPERSLRKQPLSPADRQGSSYPLRCSRLPPHWKTPARHR